MNTDPPAAVVSPATCLNCAAPLTGPFCAQCGQTSRTRRLTFRELSAHAWETVTNLDGAVPRTLRGLATRPGDFAREYVDGHRVGRMSPARFYVVTAVVLSAVFAVHPQVFALVNPRQDPARLAFEQALFVYAPLLACPLFAPLVRGCFSAAGRTVAETLAMLVYVVGFWWLVTVPWAAAAGALELSEWVAMVPAIAGPFYVTWGLVTFHRARRFRDVAVAFCTFAAFMMIVGLVAAAGRWAFVAIHGR